MSHNICNMARGKSGRVVIETDPALKRRLYTQLARDERTLKEWFIEAASTYVEQREQPPLFQPDAERKSARRRRSKDKDQ
jgi:hypothetical protein